MSELVSYVMKSEQLIEGYRQAGFRCISVGRTTWLLDERHVALALPTLVDIYPSRQDIQQLFAHKVRVASFPTCCDSIESNTVEYVLMPGDYDISNVLPRERRQTRRGLEWCKVRIATVDEILGRGLEINRHVLGRQKRSTNYLCDARRWETYAKTFLAMPDVMPFVSCVDGAIAAYLMVFLVNQTLILMHPFVDLQYKKKYPFNALLFTAITQARQKFGPLEVSYGFESVWRMKSLDHFKEGMGFQGKRRLRISLFSGWYKHILWPSMVMLLNAVPVVSDRIGSRYGALVREKSDGLNWWRHQGVIVE